MNFNVKIAKTVFNQKFLESRIFKAEYNALGQFGAYCMKVARNSLKTADGPSAPGKPPHSHGDKFLKKWIFFYVDKIKGNMSIGPEKLNHVYFGGDGKPLAGKTVPQILEEGGTIGTLEVFKYGRWIRADLRSKRRMAGLPLRLVSSKIAKRPYMLPAFNETKKRLKEFWEKSIK